MADDIDRANDYAEYFRESVIKQTRAQIKTGMPGECEECGKHSNRIINGHCAQCRDELGLG